MFCGMWFQRIGAKSICVFQVISYFGIVVHRAGFCLPRLTDKNRKGGFHSSRCPSCGVYLAGKPVMDTVVNDSVKRHAERNPHRFLNYKQVVKRWSQEQEMQQRKRTNDFDRNTFYKYTSQLRSYPFSMPIDREQENDVARRLAKTQYTIKSNSDGERCQVCHELTEADPLGLIHVATSESKPRGARWYHIRCLPPDFKMDALCSGVAGCENLSRAEKEHLTRALLQ